MNTKPKRGRPVGATSFANLTLAELNRLFKQDDVIPVGRLFLEKGMVPRTITSSQIKESTEIVNSMTDNGPKVEMTLQD